MKLSAILEPMIAAGVPGDVILATVRAYENAHADALEKRRESDRIRQAKKRDKDFVSRDSRDVTVTVPSRARVEDISSNLEITGKKEEKKESAAKPRGVDEFKSELSSILDPERIEAIIAVRRKKGAVFSAHAGKLLANALRACPNVTAAADEMVLRNWTGIKPEWLESRNQHRAGAPPKPLTQGESIRNMARKMGVIDDTGNPIRRVETSERDGEDPGLGNVIRLAIASDHGWGTG